MKHFWAILGTRDPKRARGAPPDPHGAPQRLRGHFPTTTDFGFRAAPLPRRQNPSKQASPGSGTYLDGSGLLFCSRWMV